MVKPRAEKEIKNIPGLSQKKLNKKLILFWAIILIIVFGGYFWYVKYQKNSLVEVAVEEEVSEAEDAYGKNCEEGTWVNFPPYAEKKNREAFSGDLFLKMNPGGSFSDEKTGYRFVTDENYSLIFFQGRRVAIAGFKIGGGDKAEVYVEKIKCVGEEADANLNLNRKKLMQYISQNINSLALEKSANSQWETQSFYFVNGTDLYVEYESSASFWEDAPFDGKLWLIRVSGLEREIPVIETLAYIEENPEDPAKNVVRQGEDLYKDVENMTVYGPDDETDGNWVIQ